jgi:hypothetical protein
VDAAVEGVVAAVQERRLAEETLRGAAEAVRATAAWASRPEPAGRNA